MNGVPHDLTTLAILKIMTISYFISLSMFYIVMYSIEYIFFCIESLIQNITFNLRQALFISLKYTFYTAAVKNIEKYMSMLIILTAILLFNM